MEDLVTWGATDPDKRIVETPTDKPVPTAKETLERSVIYFIAPEPGRVGSRAGAAGRARGRVAEPDYTPGAFYQRYNGNGMDLNRDWPGVGYTLPALLARPPSPRCARSVTRPPRDPGERSRPTIRSASGSPAGSTCTAS